MPGVCGGPAVRVTRNDTSAMMPAGSRGKTEAGSRSATDQLESEEELLDSVERGDWNYPGSPARRNKPWNLGSDRRLSYTGS
jgi:hypothetical protein